MNGRSDMSTMETEALTNTIRGMSEEQLRLIAKNMPVQIMCEEIALRYNVLAEKITSITNITSSI